MQRLNYFDIAKGIAIIFVIFGHSLLDIDSPPPLFYRFVSSYYMPLFFVISGYFYKPCGLWKTIKKTAKSLLPAFYLSGIWGIILSCLNCMIAGESLEDIGRYIGGLLIGPVGDFSGTSIHVLWFIGALFWGRIFLEFLNKYFSDVHTLAISIIVLVLNQRLMYYVNLQSWFYFSHGLTCLVFLCIGKYCRRFQIFEYSFSWLLIFTIFFATWFNLPSVNMDGRAFGNLFADVVMSTLLSIATLFFCKKLDLMTFKPIRLFSSLLARIGRHTLLLYSLESILFISRFSSFSLSEKIGVKSEFAQILCQSIPRFVLIFVLAFAFNFFSTFLKGSENEPFNLSARQN